MKVLALYSVKGGVGKTSSAVNLAHLAALSGFETLLWDLDHQASTTYSLRLQAGGGGARRLLKGKERLDTLIKASDYDKLDVLPARFSFRQADAALVELKDALKRFRQLITPLAEVYDLLVFDCPPGLTLMAESVLRAADAVMVPVVPTPLSLNSLRLLARHMGKSCADGGLAVWPFFSMVDVRRALHKKICVQGASLPYAPLETHIPYASQVEQMSFVREPLTAFAPKSVAGRAYASLWSEVRAKLML
ncbi:MAG: AAA family ATPase [Gammaproteobacteria bacterium]|nr:AAA family ATPase [Gammaproteobacteria bacterium]